MSKQDPEEKRLENEPVEPAEELNQPLGATGLIEQDSSDPDQLTASSESDQAPDLNEDGNAEGEPAPQAVKAEQEPEERPDAHDESSAEGEQTPPPEDVKQEPDVAPSDAETPEASEERSESEEPEVSEEPEEPEVPEEPEESIVSNGPVDTPDLAEEPQEPDSSDLDELDLDLSGEPPEEEDGTAWFVIHCYSGYENKVRHNLEQRIETMGMKDMIFDVVVPTQEEIEVRDGKRRTVERHIFPGYVLVNMILTEESWYVVRNTPGVTGFVGMGNNPTPLRPEEVAQIVKRMEADAPTVKVTYKVGERVRIIDGPFNDFRGVVAEIDMERTKVRVMVSFFGRETPVELDFLQVEKA